MNAVTTTSATDFSLQASEAQHESDSGPTVVSPFTVIVDTREQHPYTFQGLRANADQKNALIRVPTERRVLEVGDYSIQGMQTLITVERKSKEDFYQSVSQRRENFENRLRKMTENYTMSAVVVEAEWSELLTTPPKHTSFNPKSLYRTYNAWLQRWPVRWVFMPDRTTAEAAVYRFLERFYLAYQDGKWFEQEQYGSTGSYRQ